MPTNLDSFLKSVPGGKTDLKDLDCYIDKNGDIRRLDNVDVLIKSIVNLLLTAKGTYLFDPEYGCNIYKYMFEPADELVKQDIFVELEGALRRYEDRGDISYDVTFFSNKKGFIIDISVAYRGEKKTVGITIDETLLRTVQD